jgi:two-component system, OmpR family, phosphate regulon sensor histidine kinase PhoR
MTKPRAKQKMHDWPHFIVQSMADAVITVDGDMRITDFNKAAEKLTGYTRQEALGMSCGKVLQSSMCGRECPLKMAMSDGEAVTREAVLHNRHGQDIEVMLAASALRDDQGNLLGGVETFKDISPFKMIEKERRYLVSMFAHDLKSPVVSVAGLINRLRQGKVGELTPPQASYIETVYQEIQRLENLISMFLEYARLDLHIITPMPSAIQVEQECQEVINRLRPQAEAKHIVLETDYPQKIIVVQADSLLFQRALCNLVGNAIKYSPPDTRILVSVTDLDHQVKFAVQDQGPGIAPEDQVHLFELLYRGQSAGKESGLGLGLAIVKRIIDAHDGRIWVESEKGKGATFFFTLPRQPVT